jgi:cyclophilin family peptidyl-prolyl cis-trans isomerase
MRNNALLIMFSILLFTACKSDIPKGIRAEIKTTEGTITLVLYDQTPVHRDNFIKLAESGFYDGVSFHRVIRDFMIQTGDGNTNAKIPDNEKAKYEYNIPAEFNDSLFHKRGVLAAAREGDEVNPSRSSSGTQFYIVQGKKFTDEELKKVEERIDYSKKQYLYYKILEAERALHKQSGDSISDEIMQQNAISKYEETIEKTGSYKFSLPRRNIYKTTGGAPFLDGSYTVFGEVLTGMDVVDLIGNSATDITDKPVKDIKIIRIKIIR